MPDMKYPYRGGKDWGLLTLMDIEDQAHPGKVYLRRLVVCKTPWASLYLHLIYVPDADRDLHNHPMSFWSWVVSGGYEERRTTMADPGFRPKRWRKRWSIARTTKADFHTITSLDRTPTMTLLLCGRRDQDWGFLTDRGFVNWRAYGKVRS